MFLRLEPRMVQLCPICKTNRANPDEHDQECPRAQAEAAIRTAQRWRCPKCPGTVDLTLDDYLECRRCRRIYSSGQVAGGYNPDKLERVYMRQTSPVDLIDQYVQVLVFPTLSTKLNFRIDHILKQLKRLEKIKWLKHR